MIGNVVITRSTDPDSLDMEDAIIFTSEGFSLEIIIHPIVGISDGETGIRLKRKVYNNSNFKDDLIWTERIIGKVVFQFSINGRWPFFFGN